ncbi:MAG TPA: F0F1 ATP synthase subunit epsilon [Myxococcales bacterium]|nr:F0F1 ATP synthase subunit epsilon [Myxococcales bacterium]
MAADLLHGKLQLDVVTPEARVLSLSCDEVRAPGADGGFGVRPGHTPFITTLAPGVLTAVSGGREDRYAIAGGFCEVAENRVTVLAEFAQHAAEIDPAAAIKEHDEAVKRMHEAQNRDEAAFRREAAVVRRAAARVAATRHRS